MKLLVLGSSGGVGRHLVTIAADRGHDVTALARGTSAVPEGARITVVRGDVDTEATATFDRVLPGHDAVVSGLGLRRVSKSVFAEMSSRVDFVSTTMQALTDAMLRHGVRNAVQVSAAGVGDSAPGMNAIMRFLIARSNIGHAYRDLDRAERTLNGSGVNWCAPRPCTLTNGRKTESVRVVDKFGMTMKISRADVAWFMVTCAEEMAAGKQLSARTPQIAA
jgi:putative NADH-flavin reductase